MPDAAKGNKKWMILSIVFLVGAIFLFVAGVFFYGHMRDNTAPYTPSQITEKIIGDLQYSDLAEVDSSLISKHYDIPSGTVTSCSVYMSKSSESAVELNCFLLTDTSKYENLQAAVTAHMSTKAAGFKSLNPTQYSQLKNYLIERRGRYVLVAVGKDTVSEDKIFRNMLNEKALA
jgi:hypothetical protein